MGTKSVRSGRRGVKRDAGPSGERCNANPVGRFAHHRRPGAFGRQRRRSSLEVDGTMARLAPSRCAKIASVKWVNI